jgi:hypothetical protein
MRGLIVAIVVVLTTNIAIAQTPKLMLFGGSDHDVYLGCLNCGSVATDSLCNDFGRYGNEFSGDSIWNEFSRFGNEFSGESPWNEFSTQAPVIVDNDGHFYGHFSTNELHPQRTQIRAFVTLLDRARKLKLPAVQKLLCR